MDPARHKVLWDAKDVTLTVTEFLILEALAQRPGVVKSRNQLLDIAYQDDVYVDDRTIDSHIKRVRRKFRTVDPEFDGIETLRRRLPVRRRIRSRFRPRRGNGRSPTGSWRSTCWSWSSSRSRSCISMPSATSCRTNAPARSSASTIDGSALESVAPARRPVLMRRMAGRTRAGFTTRVAPSWPTAGSGPGRLTTARPARSRGASRWQGRSTAASMRWSAPSRSRISSNPRPIARRPGTNSRCQGQRQARQQVRNAPDLTPVSVGVPLADGSAVLLTVNDQLSRGPFARSAARS